MDAELDERIKTVAEWYLKNGISVIPISTEKKPAVAWSEYVESPMPEWSFPGCNLALLTGIFNGVIVVDCDTPESAAWWWQNKKRTPLMTRTKRGVHYIYKHPGGYIKSDSHITAAEGIEYDVRGDRAYVLVGPSLRGGHQYQFIINDDNLRGAWVHPDKLPEFDPAWRPERVQQAAWDDRKEIKDMRAYLSKIFAREGAGGDKETYRACCILAENNIHESEALAMMYEWNETNATPKWSPSEILRKLRAAYS